MVEVWQFLTNIIEYAKFYDIAMSQYPTLGTLKQLVYGLFPQIWLQQVLTHPDLEVKTFNYHPTSIQLYDALRRIYEPHGTPEGLMMVGKCSPSLFGRPAAVSVFGAIARGMWQPHTCLQFMTTPRVSGWTHSLHIFFTGVSQNEGSPSHHRFTKMGDPHGQESCLKREQPQKVSANSTWSKIKAFYTSNRVI